TSIFCITTGYRKADISQLGNSQVHSWPSCGSLSVPSAPHNEARVEDQTFRPSECEGFRRVYFAQKRLNRDQVKIAPSGGNIVYVRLSTEQNITLIANTVDFHAT